MPMNGFVTTVLLVQAWIRASVSAYSLRSEIWREVFGIAFARIQVGTRPRFLLGSLRFMGTTTLNDGVTRARDTRGLAVY